MNLNHIRRPLFWLFTAAFFVTSALVLFTAFGYRFNFERGIFVYSGSITLKSTPTAVSVKLDGEAISAKSLGIINSSIHIAGLMPGEHFIEVSAQGFHPWIKKVLVQSGRSTEFWNVVLVRDTYDITPLPDTAGALSASLDPKGQFLAIIKKVNDETSVVVMDRGNGTTTQVFASNRYSFDAARAEEIVWSPDRKKLILPIQDGNRNAYIIIDRETGTAEALSDFFTAGEFEGARWDDNGQYTLFFLADHNLYRVDLGGDRAVRLVVEKVRTFDMSGPFVYLARLSDGMVLRFRAMDSGENLTQISTAPPAGLEDVPTTLRIYDEKRFALIEHGGAQKLFVYNDGLEENYGFREIATNVSDGTFSNDGKKFLFSNGNEMSVYFTRSWDVEPVRAENTIVQLARFSDRIANVHWTEDYEHVLYSQGNTVKMIELDNRDRRVIVDVLSLEKSPLQTLLLFRENLLFLVLPDSGLQTLVFPQPQGIFGQ